MNFRKKTKLSSEIPTSSMPDIIFMLLIFFMVTTVLRTYSGLPIELPRAKKIAKLASKRHTTHVWLSKDGYISIQDKGHKVDDVRHTIWGIRAADPQLTISMKTDKNTKMGLVVAVQNEFRKAEALKLNYSTLTAMPTN